MAAAAADIVASRVGKVGKSGGKASSAQKQILFAVGGAVAVVYVVRIAAAPGDVLKKPGAMIRIAVGGAVVAIVLMVVAESQPRFAKSMGWLVFAGTAFVPPSSPYLFMAAKVISNVVTRKDYTVQQISGGQAKAGAAGEAEGKGFLESALRQLNPLNVINDAVKGFQQLGKTAGERIGTVTEAMPDNLQRYKAALDEYNRQVTAWNDRRAKGQNPGPFPIRPNILDYEARPATAYGMLPTSGTY